MTNQYHIIVEIGPEKGKLISIPLLKGARLGRSSRNDIVLSDPLLSRHHCRLFFKPHDGLWVADLASANGTLLNNKPVQESKLNVGDLITIGDTVLKVLNIHTGVEKAQPPHGGTGSAFDLGLTHDNQPKAKSKHIGTGPLIIALIIVIAIAMGIWLPKFLKNQPSSKSPAAQPEKTGHTIEINYEKVEATTQNIFRYKLSISKQGILSVQIDDIQNNEHVQKEKQLNSAYIQTLAQTILESGFFDLSPVYLGIRPESLNQFDMAVTLDKKTHRVKVTNRLEPQSFVTVKDMLELCARNELSLQPLQFSTEKRIELAQKAYAIAQKLYNEKTIAIGNMSAAIASLNEAEWYLETVEPKPAFYANIVTLARDSKDELNAQYDNKRFNADRAIKMEEWESAQRELQIICELIPNRSDARNEKARKDLLYVESRLKLGNK